MNDAEVLVKLLLSIFLFPWGLLSWLFNMAVWKHPVGLRPQGAFSFSEDCHFKSMEYLPSPIAGARYLGCLVILFSLNPTV